MTGEGEHVQTKKREVQEPLETMKSTSGRLKEPQGKRSIMKGSKGATGKKDKYTLLEKIFCTLIKLLTH